MQTKVEVTDARQAGQVAGRYRDLQGLRQVAGGVGLLFLFGVEMVTPLSLSDIRSMGIERAEWGLGVAVAAFAVMILAVVWISAWYRRHYGSVEPTVRQRRLGMLIGGTGVLAFLVPLNIDSIAMNYGSALPVNLADFTLALWIVGYWLYLGRSFHHYLVLAALGFVLGLASMAGIPPATFDWHVREATLYFAFASIVGGVIDHRILTSALPRIENRIGVES